MEITWMGNEHTNSSSREGYVPFVIVNHISAGTMSSMDAWFRSPDNRVSSAHFGISKAGEIHQYVDIKRMAWAQGIPKEQIPNAEAEVVRKMGVNPNLYCVSIEHEGMVGELTPEQFNASVKLHRYIQDQIYEIWQKEFSLTPYYVIGHYQINPTGKPYCPGRRFPWERLYAALEKVDRLKEAEQMEELQRQVEELRRHMNELAAENQRLGERIQSLETLHNQPEIPTWAADAVQAAVEGQLVLNPENGSLDFYRILTVLHRKGLI
ncbi:N-acetylmuramoyl-L-alanine amidase [Marinicrinis lubricantis]|uniref:N-acetylmuramoyl-L-alanine amidase n=1 Tax=Marinicrinis lubricantis TaxID=2086470 RepID=A0ABW1IQK6_9BACL